MDEKEIVLLKRAFLALHLSRQCAWQTYNCDYTTYIRPPHAAIAIFKETGIDKNAEASNSWIASQA